MTVPDISAAQRFLASHARILDRRRFERLFAGGAARPVRDAVAAYRNDDGGFGHALEPDGRTPGSQPAAIALALRTLHEADAWDPDLAAGACDWLERNAAAGGGATFVEPNVEGWPHAPWWVPQRGRPRSPLTTGQIAGMLYARRISHTWLTSATEVMWDLIATADAPGAYDMHGILAFLQHVPDRDRADAALDGVGQLLFDRGLVALDPDAPGEVHGPLNFAPRPDSIGRRLFDPPTIEAHLDRLAAGQQEDGGWMFDWVAWNAAAELEWRGSLTVDALQILRANGRDCQGGPSVLRSDDKRQTGPSDRENPANQQFSADTPAFLKQ